MTKNRSRKQRTRQRMESTGESFVQASSKMEDLYRQDRELQQEVRNSADHGVMRFHYIHPARGTRLELPGTTQLPEGYELFEIQIQVRGDAPETSLLTELLSLQDPDRQIRRRPLRARADEVLQRREITQDGISAEILLRSALRVGYPSAALVERVLYGKVSLDDLLRDWPEDQPAQADFNDRSPRGELVGIVEEWMLGKGGRETWEDSYSHDIGWHMLEEWLEKPKPVTTVFSSSAYPNPVVRGKLMELFGMDFGMDPTGKLSGRIIGTAEVAELEWGELRFFGDERGYRVILLNPQRQGSREFVENLQKKLAAELG